MKDYNKGFWHGVTLSFVGYVLGTLLFLFVYLR